MKITEDRAKKGKENKGTSRSHQLQQQLVGGTSSIIGMFHFICRPGGTLLPCLCRLLAIHTSTAVSLLLPLWPSFPPPPWAPPTADAPRCKLNCASSSCHLTMNRSAASRTPRYHFSAFLLQWTTARSQLQTPRGSVPFTLRWLGTLKYVTESQIYYIVLQQDQLLWEKILSSQN